MNTTKSESGSWMLSFLKVSGYRGVRIFSVDGASGSELTFSFVYVLETRRACKHVNDIGRMASNEYINFNCFLVMWLTEVSAFFLFWQEVQ